MWRSCPFDVEICVSLQSLARHGLGESRADVERRRTARYKLCLPLIFKWTDDSGTPIEGAGFTRDISTSGLYASCAKLPPINATLHLQILLPPDKKVLPHSLRLWGRVVRTRAENEDRGIGVAGELAM